MSIESRNRVIHDEDVRASINSASQSDSSFLAAREIDAFFTNLSFVACRHDSQVRLQLASGHCFDVLALFISRAEEDIVAEFAVLNPGLLLAVAGGAMDRDRALLSQIGCQEGIFNVPLLTVFDGACLVADFFNCLLREVDKLANHRVEKRTLAGAGRADDHSEGTLLHLDVEVLEADHLLKSATF